MLQAEQMHKMTSISLKMVEVVILSENSCHFVTCSACNNSFFSAWDKSRFNGTTPKIQQWKGGPQSNKTKNQVPSVKICS